jgi:peptidoglycan/LPS O-acetylase OafA/YrhL
MQHRDTGGALVERSEELAAPPPRVAYIDGLRGVAALTVAWFHIYANTLESTRDWLGPTISAIFNRGRFGVHLFFVLSGFVLALTLIKPRPIRRASDVARYMLRRSVRLDIPYWACAALYVVAAPLIIAYPSVFRVWEWKLSAWHALSSALYFIPILGDHKVVPVVWTLVLEVQFYLLFALALYAAERIAQRTGRDIAPVQVAALAALAVVAALWRLGIIPYYQLIVFPYLSLFLLGVSAFLLVERLRGAALITALTLLPIAVGQLRVVDTAMLAGVLSLVLVLVASAWAPLRNALASKLALVLGALSYTVYLLHSLLGNLVVQPLHPLAHRHPAFGLLACVLALTATFVVSAAIWRWVEVPSIALSRRVRMSGQRAAR